MNHESHLHQFTPSAKNTVLSLSYWSTANRRKPERKTAWETKEIWHEVNVWSGRTCFFEHFGAVDHLFKELQSRLDKIAKEINRISRSTQQWQRADDFRRSIQSRLDTIDEKGKQIAKNGAEADDKISQLLPKEAQQSPHSEKKSEPGKTI